LNYIFFITKAIIIVPFPFANTVNFYAHTERQKAIKRLARLTGYKAKMANADITLRGCSGKIFRDNYKDLAGKCTRDTTLGFRADFRFNNDTYRISEVLGAGNFGVVWKAVVLKDTDSLKTGNEVALKFTLTKDKKEREFVKKEVDRLKELAEQKERSPHLLKLHETFEYTRKRSTGEKRTETCLVLQLVGSSLKRRCNDVYKNSGLPLSELKSTVKKCLEGVQYMHKLKMIHSDIKPDNICLEGDNNIILVDMDGDAFTAEYSSPEFVKSHHREYIPPMDIWALGCTFYEIGFGIKLFEEYNYKTKADNKAHLKQIDAFRAMDTNSRFEYLQKCLDEKIFIGKDKVKEFLEFLKPMLEYDSGKRATADEMLQHEWLADAI
jgi:serine/threonine protein kinase